MAQEKVMGWVERLPNVGVPILVRRERIECKVQSAARLVEQAKMIRAEAYRDGLALMREVHEQWTLDEVDQAKNA